MNQMDYSQLTIITPTFNEADNVPELIDFISKQSDTNKASFRSLKNSRKLDSQILTPEPD